MSLSRILAFSLPANPVLQKTVSDAYRGAAEKEAQKARELMQARGVTSVRIEVGEYQGIPNVVDFIHDDPSKATEREKEATGSAMREVTNPSVLVRNNLDIELISYTDERSRNS